MILNVLAAFNRMRPGLGTFVEIRLKGRAPARDLEDAGAAGFREIARVERLMSFHSKDSDLTRLNQTAVGYWIQVDPRTARVLRMALRIQKDSEGIFNAAVADVLVKRGLLPSHGRKLRRSVQGVGPVQPVKPAFEVQGRRARRLMETQIDLGGIAKGFAVDCATRAIRRRFKGSGVVNAGGDLRAFGRERAQISVRLDHGGRRGPLSAQRIWLREGAVATSYSLSDKVIPGDGKRKATMLKTEKTVSVIARDCLTADALTKVALIGDSDVVSRCLRKYGARIL